MAVLNVAIILMITIAAEIDSAMTEIVMVDVTLVATEEEEEEEEIFIVATIEAVTAVDSAVAALTDFRDEIVTSMTSTGIITFKEAVVSTAGM